MLNINALKEPGIDKAVDSTPVVHYLNKVFEARSSEGTSSCSLFRKQGTY